jgi:hypothetical protein
MNKLICQFCNLEFKNIQSIAAHLSNHNITTKEYYDKFYKKEIEGKCLLCRCDNKYIGLNKGYKKYCNKCRFPKTLEQYQKVYGIQEGIKKYNIRFKDWSNKRQGKNNPNYDSNKVNVFCENCNKEFRPYTNPKHHFCSRKCKAEWQHKNPVPLELNPFHIYKDKIYEINKEHLKDPVFRYNRSNTLREHLKDKEYRNKRTQQILNTKIKNGTLNNCFKYHSKKSSNFFNNLIAALPKNLTYYFGEKETFIRDKNKIVFVDFECRENKCIIEYYGDYFHANPFLYNDKIKYKGKEILCEDIWQKDKERIEFIQSKGYKVLIIWEYDCDKYLNSMLEKCKNFIINT